MELSPTGIRISNFRDSIIKYSTHAHPHALGEGSGKGLTCGSPFWDQSYSSWNPFRLWIIHVSARKSHEEKNNMKRFTTNKIEAFRFFPCVDLIPFHNWWFCNSIGREWFSEGFTHCCTRHNAIWLFAKVHMARNEQQIRRVRAARDIKAPGQKRIKSDEHACNVWTTIMHSRCGANEVH